MFSSIYNYYKLHLLNAFVYSDFLITGLETCVNLRSIYLQQNGIQIIEGLDTLIHLKTINLSQNRIIKIEGLSKLINLETLNLSKNSISGDNCMTHLLECPSITNLDVTSNELEDPNILQDILAKMPVLSCVYLKGNGMVSKFKKRTLFRKM